MTGYELGALFNFFIPSLVGLVSLIILLLVFSFSNDKTGRIATVIILCLIILMVGRSFYVQGRQNSERTTSGLRPLPERLGGLSG